MGIGLDSLGGAVLAVAAVAAAGVASMHAVLTKRDVRAAIGWTGLIWLVPFAGVILYGLFGINRIRRRASVLRPPHPPPAAPPADRRPSRTGLAAMLPPDDAHLEAVSRVTDTLSPMPLVFGNAVTLFASGEATFAAMRAAIAGARRSVGLASYIFDNDAVGTALADALAAAASRGVAVRVLVDGVGARYSYPPMPQLLRRRGVVVAEFLPTFVPLHWPYANLRNHRKILCVDGTVAFTGGINIRAGHVAAAGSAPAIRDVHAKLEGPIVQQLAETFLDDWLFCTGEALPGEFWLAVPRNAGSVAARAIPAGPDADVERLRWVILGALSQAKRRVRVVTPYFLPDTMLATALVLAAMRGVVVDIVVPGRGNLRLVQWASRVHMGSLIEGGCRIWETPPPFDHAKMMTVDGLWSMIGSANWDERSLRLNFELNVECYDAQLATAVDALIENRLAAARPLSLAELNGRGLAVKLRDGTAWLLSPYL